MNFLNKNAGVIALVALIIAIGVWAFSSSSPKGFGAVECASGQTCLNSLELTGPLSGVTNALQIDSGIFNTAGDVAVTGGTISATTAANATSTVVAGCVQTYATSSATSIVQVFNNQATTSSINGNTIQGVVLWAYGRCPNL